MACGTPVLLSEETARAFDEIRRVASVSDLEPGTLERFASALADRAKLERLRAAAGAFVREHWSWTVAVDTYESILHQATASRPRTP
jgi:glycosyltransferase involved in cell wall biosynthesis